MRLRTFALRLLSLAFFAVWFGGFTFYGAAAIPVLHDELDSLQAGEITRRVTVLLNFTGVVAVGLGWASEFVDRAASSNRCRRIRRSFFVTTTVLLGFLIFFHQIMDRHLDLIGTRGFYRLHRVYLIASTLQWIVNLGLLALTAYDWREVADGPVEPARSTRGSA